MDEVEILCADGVSLSGHLYRPEDQDMPAQAAVVISSGTGFPKQFYGRLAAFLAARGALVLTYDYRGIGGSGAAQADASIDIPDWGRLDLDASIRFLANKAGAVPLITLGHSVGGHLVGFASSHPLVSKHVFVSCGSGTWHRHWVTRWPLELYFWWVLGPLSIWRSGRVGAKGGWRGEALPAKVFRTWRRWSHQPSYYGEELRQGLSPQFFDACDRPIRSWIFTDDGIATPRAARDILDCYPNAPSEISVISPSELGLRQIGHHGAFREDCKALWEDWWAWMTQGERREPISP